MTLSRLLRLRSLAAPARARCASFPVVLLLSLLCASGASAQVNVTTYHNDNHRTGLNSNETILAPTNVNLNSFGKLFSVPVDGYVYAQPLYLSNLSIPGKGIHNVVFVATQHDSVYAIDADQQANPLWHVHFGASVPNTEVGSWDIVPEIGITGTPVIDATTGTLYVVAKTKQTGGNGNVTYTQKLHALDVTTGAEKFGGPVTIHATVPGTGDGTDGNGNVPFNPLIQNQRCALTLIKRLPKLAAGQPPWDLTYEDVIVIGWASHGDNGPYHGWIMAYDAQSLQQIAVFNSTPNGKTDPSGYPIAAGGVWQGGAGPAVDSYGNLYFETGNGSFNAAEGSFGDSFVKLTLSLFGTPRFFVNDYFTPSNQLSLDDSDEDLGSGGALIIPQPFTFREFDALGGFIYPWRRDFVVGAGKQGSIYVLDSSNMGQYNPASDQIVQELPNYIGGVWGMPAYFNNTIYYGGSWDYLRALPVYNGSIAVKSSSTSNVWIGFPGPTPAISSNGLTNGIVWTIQTDQYSSGGPAILHAFDANNLSNELYNSANGRDDLGGAVKFSVPTIANGKVYVGTAGALNVFGSAKYAPAPMISPNGGEFSSPVTVSLSDSLSGAKIYYTTDGTAPTTNSTLYTGPFSVTISTEIRAIATATGYATSLPAQASILIEVPAGNGDGLFGSYYNNINLTGTPVTRVDPTINFNWNGSSPINGIGGDNWSAQWTGYVQPRSTGTYTFYTYSDDGVQLWVNGTQLVNDWTYHAPTWDSGTISLTAGQKYPVQINYFQGGGGSLMQLYWSIVGIPAQIIPQSQLYSH